MRAPALVTGPATALLATALLALAGCSVDGDYSDSHFSCAGGEACPAGFDCLGGVCTRGGGGDGDGGTADASDASDLADGGPDSPDAALSDAGPCLGSPPIADDFDDGVAGSQWAPYHSGMAAVIEAGGELVVRPANNQGGNRSAGYRSAAPVDARDARLFVRVPVMVNQATSARAYLRLGTTTDQVAFEQHGGTLSCLLVAGGSSSPVVELSYDADAHRYWQLREQAGTLTWETSADGASWTPLASAASPAALAAATVDLGASTAGAIAGPGEVHFDDLDTGPAACP
jgi:hypothetical protein